MATIDTTELYDNADSFPDLTIKLDDNRRIKLHRIVLCRRNPFFDHLAGGGAIKHRSLTFRGDPEAAELLLRSLYGFVFPHHTAYTWELWLNLTGLATKVSWLELQVSASKNLRLSAEDETDASEAYRIINVLGDSDSQELRDMSTSLRKHHAVKLLSLEAYRNDITYQPETMWEHLDALVASSRNVPLQARSMRDADVQARNWWDIDAASGAFAPAQVQNEQPAQYWD